MSGLSLWWVVLRRWRGLLGRGITVDLILAAMTLARPLLLGWLIDRSLHGGSLLPPLLGLAAAWGVRLLLGSLRERLLATAARLAGLDLRRRIARHLRDLPQERLAALGGTGLAVRLEADLRRLQSVLVHLPAGGLVAVVRVAAALAVLAILHPSLALVLLPFLPLLPWLMRSATAATRSAAHAAAVAQARLEEGWQEARTLVLPGLRAWMAGDLAARAEAAGRVAVVQAQDEAPWQPLVLLVVTAGAGAILVVGAQAIAAGSLTPGGLAVSLFLVFIALGPVLELATLAGQAGPALAATTRIQDFLDEPTESGSCNLAGG
jgi:ABC-type multidrug transport system fused ATPase/permease subunit